MMLLVHAWWSVDWLLDSVEILKLIELWISASNDCVSTQLGRLVKPIAFWFSPSVWLSVFEDSLKRCCINTSHTLSCVLYLGNFFDFFCCFGTRTCVIVSAVHLFDHARRVMATCHISNGQIWSGEPMVRWHVRWWLASWQSFGVCSRAYCSAILQRVTMRIYRRYSHSGTGVYHITAFSANLMCLQQLKCAGTFTHSSKRNPWICLPVTAIR